LASADEARFMPRIGGERAGGKGGNGGRIGRLGTRRTGASAGGGGALAGFLAGVPLEVRTPPRIGTFLDIIIPTSISSYRAHDAPAAAFHFALA
jgi:hypothetical protein